MADKLKFTKVKLPLHFNGVSINDDTASVGFKVLIEDFMKEPTGDKAADRKAAVGRIDELLCVRQLKGNINLGRRSDGETQGKLMETDIAVSATFETNRISFGAKEATGKLSMPLKDVDARELVQFSHRDGWFTITSLMEAIEVDEEKKADDNDAGRPMLGNGKQEKAKAK